MSYQVIARKWRPQRFADLVGQEHLARTLKNAIISGRIAHAYLFVGPRGIGKTTAARIFAKALNCLHPENGEPCCRCSACRSIAEESNVDVVEIDAATHTQVEKARELCESVLHLPIASKYKVYIIDEVHMLSKSAWNALLKTIEEPPAHAKFIFATTEVNKVLPTVISRCQRFDLRRIKAPDIAARLRLICDSEKIRISDSALQVIARAADGGMRDAQSLLDQIISFFGTGAGQTEITGSQALSLFGIAAAEDMEKLVRAIIANDRAGAVTLVHRFAEAGKNLEALYEEIIAWLRGILLCRIVDNPAEILEETPERLAVYSGIAANAKPDAVQRLMEQLSASGYLLRESINKQVFLESILLKAMRIAHAVQIENLIARLNQIRANGELDALNSVVPLYEMPPGQIVVPQNSAFAPAHSSSTPAVVRIGSSAPAEKPEETEKTEPPIPSAPPASAVQAERTEPPVPAEKPEETGKNTSSAEDTTPESLWEKLILDVRDSLKKEVLAIAMEDGTPESLRDFRLTVAFDEEYETLQFNTVSQDLPLLIRRFRDVSGNPGAHLALTRREGLFTPEQKQEHEDLEKLKRETASDPGVAEALDLFQGRLADVFRTEE